MKTIVQGVVLSIGDNEGKPYIMIKTSDNVSKIQSYIDSQTKKDYVPLRPFEKDGIVEEGFWVFRASTKFAVTTVNQARKPIEFSSISKGDTVNIQVTLQPSKKPSGKQQGVSAYLNAVQLVKKNEGNDFQVIEEDNANDVPFENVTEPSNW